MSGLERITIDGATCAGKKRCWAMMKKGEREVRAMEEKRLVKVRRRRGGSLRQKMDSALIGDLTIITA